MTKIILACCIVHSFLLGIDEPDSVCINEGNPITGQASGHLEYENVEMPDTTTECASGIRLRDEIVAKIWEDYLRRGQSPD